MAGDTFAAGTLALGVCDICGFTYKLKRLKDQYEKDTNTHIKACPTCWSESHPQLRLGDLPVRDPQALREPRTDTATHASSRSTVVPIIQTRVAATRLGNVTVSTT